MRRGKQRLQESRQELHRTAKQKEQEHSVGLVSWSLLRDESPEESICESSSEHGIGKSELSSDLADSMPFSPTLFLPYHRSSKTQIGPGLREGVKDTSVIGGFTHRIFCKDKLLPLPMLESLSEETNGSWTSSVQGPDLARHWGLGAHVYTWPNHAHLHRPCLAFWVPYY